MPWWNSSDARLADHPEPGQPGRVLEPAVVHGAHHLLHAGRVHARRDQRTDDRSGRRAGHTVEPVAAFLEHRDGPDQADALDAAALQHEVGA